MLDPRLRTLILRVLEKTKSSELQWREGVADEEYQVDFPNYLMSLMLAKDRYGVRTPLMSIIGEKGIALESVHAHELEQSEETLELSAALDELYALAKRQALRVHHAIDELLQQVG